MKRSHVAPTVYRLACASLVTLASSAAWMAPAALAQRASGPLQVLWRGQDGQDRAGPSSAPGPSGVQDIHLVIGGIPPQVRLTRARVTALGGGEWVSDAAGGPWRVVIDHQPGAPTADLFFEPARDETGRPFTVDLGFDGGQTFTLSLPGGRAELARRAAAATLQLRWLGADGADLVGLGPSVGPDNRPDAWIELGGLTPQQPITTVDIDVTDARGWSSGVNPEKRHNAQLDRSPAHPETARLAIQPDAPLAGKPLRVRVRYANGTADEGTLTAGPVAVDPLPAPKPTELVAHNVRVAWLGQDGRGPTPGDVHLRLSGLPLDRPLYAIALSGPDHEAWFLKADERVPVAAEPNARPLAFQRDARDRTQADLFFAPATNVDSRACTLAIHHDAGQVSLVSFTGNACDPDRQSAPPPSGDSIRAHPGDDLNTLAARHGSIELDDGVYTLSTPLILPHPVRIKSAPGAATLVFQQPATAVPWTAAIKILAGHTLLEGFRVRFEGPVRWRQDVSYGPGVIATTDEHDPPGSTPLPIRGLELRGLDIEGPAATDPGSWTEAVRLARLMAAHGGRIESNTLRGGMIELREGPWTLSQNRFLGTRPGTFSPAVFSIHDPVDLLVADNHAASSSDAGKTWRFLVMTGKGARNIVRQNQVAGIGPRDDDPPALQGANAPEIILTESYGLHFEGLPAAIEHDGRILRLRRLQGDPVATGASVAILSGPRAGAYHRVAHVLDPTTLVIEPPLPADRAALSLATGFTDTTIERNTIDCRGGSVAAPLVLVGNLFGTRVVGNTFLGGGDAFKIAACPSERPVFWGWSHNPLLGVEITGNQIVDSLRGGLLCVEAGDPVKSSQDRLYATAQVRDNTFRWTAATPPDVPALTLGDRSGSPPADALAVELQANHCEGYPRGSTLRIVAGTINGTAQVDQHAELP